MAVASSLVNSDTTNDGPETKINREITPIQMKLYCKFDQSIKNYKSRIQTIDDTQGETI